MGLTASLISHLTSPDRRGLKRDQQRAPEDKVEASYRHGRGNHEHLGPVDARQQDPEETRRGRNHLPPAGRSGDAGWLALAGRVSFVFVCGRQPGAWSARS